MTAGDNDCCAFCPPVLESLEPRLLLDAVRMPWLAGVTTTTVYVCVEATNNTEDAVVDYGLDGSYGMQATTESAQWVNNPSPTESRWVHNVKLTGLLPNTEYHYQLTHGSSVSADRTFWTAPEPGTYARWGFTADSQAGSTSVHNSMAAMINGATYDPKMMVYGGDLCASGTYASWVGEWFVSNQNTLNSTTPWVNTPGNHECWYIWTQGFTQATDGDGVNGNAYFSFDYGDAHILMMHADNLSDLDPGSDFWNFVASDISTATATWKIVVNHIPAYSWDGAGSWGPKLQNMTTQLFEPNGVDVFLAGHYHFYQRNVVNGIQHVIVSSYGGDPNTVHATPYTVSSDYGYHFAMIETTSTMLTLSAYRNNGSLIDSFTLSKDPTPPTAPTGLAAAAVSDTEMWLTWNESSDPETGVDHYNVYRDSVLVGTTTQTCYSDMALDELTSYTYEVSAVNGDGVEGAKSSPVAQSTLADTTAPEIFTVWSAWPTEVEVMFSEPVEAATAEVAGNYTIDHGMSVSSAALQADTKSVKLIVSTLSESTTYTVTINNVRDRAATPNAIAADSQATFEYVPWQNQDVGSPSPAGSMSYSAGQYTIESNGHDIFDASDDFHFVYRTLDSDGEIIARAVNDTGLPAAKSGVMMRDSLAGSSTEVCMVFGHQVTSAWYQTRYTTAGGTFYSSASGITAPEYTKVVRLNGEFTGYISEDGLTWTQVGGATAPGDMTSGSVYWGLAACSHATGTLGTFYMDNVKVIEYGPNAAPAGSADGYCVNQDAHLNVAPSRGVLDNDTDADGDAISAVLVSGVTHGTVDLYANGSFGYTPADGYSGPDSFTYRANDGRGESSEVTVTINVAAIGNIPGDANRDDTVDGQDFTILKAYYGDYGCWDHADFNSDCITDGQDFTILKAYYGESVSPPSGSAAAFESSAAGGDGYDFLSDFAAGVFATTRLAARGAPGLLSREDPRDTACKQAVPDMSGRVARLACPAVRIRANTSCGQAVPHTAGLSSRADLSDPKAAGAHGPTLEVELDAGLVDVLAAGAGAGYRAVSPPGLIQS